MIQPRLNRSITIAKRKKAAVIRRDARLPSKKPAQQSQQRAENQTGDNRKEKRRVAFLNPDIAGQPAERTEPACLPDYRSGDGEQKTQNNQRFSQNFHTMQPSGHAEFLESPCSFWKRRI
jgi:hypothetical protein